MPRRRRPAVKTIAGISVFKFEIWSEIIVELFLLFTLFLLTDKDSKNGSLSGENRWLLLKPIGNSSQFNSIQFNPTTTQSNLERIEQWVRIDTFHSICRHLQYAKRRQRLKRRPNRSKLTRMSEKETLSGIHFFLRNIFIDWLNMKSLYVQNQQNLNVANNQQQQQQQFIFIDQ